MLEFILYSGKAGQNEERSDIMEGWSKSAKIPAHVKNGRLELLEGQPFPELYNDRVVEIVVPATAFVNDRDRMLYTLKQDTVLFPPGVDLWISFSSIDCTLRHELSRFIKHESK